MPTRNPWPRVYQEHRGLFWGTEPTTFAQEVTRYLRAGKIIDLGCGEGRDVLFFAQRGLEASGLDTSLLALRRARQCARTAGVGVRFQHGQIATYRWRSSYQAVFSCGVLHYIGRGQRPRLFARMKAHTVPGGLNAHIVFTDRKVYVEFSEVADYFTRGELTGYYDDWKLVGYDEFNLPCAQDGTPHEHSVVKLIARRP